MTYKSTTSLTRSTQLITTGHCQKGLNLVLYFCFNDRKAQVFLASSKKQNQQKVVYVQKHNIKTWSWTHEKITMKKLWIGLPFLE
ncbi:hypothetical protein CISIN_1g034761mg [Citrus sinensis]|uniref:Uncharacterized protein n=1 Tax=Citrus sinensis TaxID=2711 RepID=A0A067DRL7_CITSI|nr:hypothetical protein CISIN_1g034761mg [Citrus sinensis]